MRPHQLLGFATLASFTLLARAQAPAPKANPASREAEALAEPFKGVTADGKVQPGLFSIRSTGVSTEPVRKARRRFSPR